MGPADAIKYGGVPPDTLPDAVARPVIAMLVGALINAVPPVGRVPVTVTASTVDC